MNLDLLVILCAGNFTNYKKYTDFLDSGVYIGAKTRMESGIPLVSKAKKVLLIGGSKRKVLAMKRYYQENLKPTPDNLVCIVSGPSTYGNIYALNKYIETYVKKLSHIGILTSCFHFTRMYSFVFKVFSDYSQRHSNIIPICSEIILESDSLSDPRFYNMVNLESNGVIDLKKNTYRKRSGRFEII